MGDSRKIYETLDLLGMRAQAAAIGMIQLAVELNKAGVLDDAAIARIKEAVFGEISLRRPVAVSKEEFERTMRRRLDALFAGTEVLGKSTSATVEAVIHSQ